MKKFISGIIIGAILTTSVTALASTTKSIQAIYSVKRLIVNGVDTGKGDTAFVSNGTTYVPLRTVSDALGHEISWDSNTKTIYINTGNSNSNSGEPTDLPITPNNNANSNNAVTLPSNQVTNNQAGQSYISVDKARAIALQKSGGGTVLVEKFKSDYDDDDYEDESVYFFKIKNVNTIYIIEVDALTGVVVEFERH